MEAAGMSEYQYYEVLALDRPLTGKQRAELRSISTRAEITATRFVNEYQWAISRVTRGKCWSGTSTRTCTWRTGGRGS